MPLLQEARSLSEAEQVLSQIIDSAAITPYFQPIFDLLTGDAVGHEALSRGPENSLLFTPDALFQTAIAMGRLHELELVCRSQALSRFAALKLPGKLYLNISASLLASSDHQKGMTLALLEKMQIERERIVIELSEKQPYDHFGLSRAAVEYYREMGFQVAIDDLGVGYSGLRMWSELQPECVKIDQHFVRGVDRDMVKREFILAIVSIAKKLQCELIAEGIETKEELDTLIELGVSRGQGFLLGKPHPEPSRFHSDFLSNRARRMEEKTRMSEDETVLSLCRTMPAVNETQMLHEVDRLFKKTPELDAVPVLNNGIPVGIVRRQDLLELFSAQYGRALYEKKPASSVMSQDMLVVESYVGLSKVSYQLTNQDTAHLTSEIIIVQDGVYLGVGSLRDLLKRITDLKIQNATYSNPLTLLPGNVPINREIDRRLKQALEFRVAYFDLNDFKPFNDYYGYAKGDQVIQLLGRIIKRCITSSDCFVGHIGGDDFVVIFGCLDYAARCQQILDEFADEVREYYAPKELQEGGIWAVNRAQERSFHQILSLAIGIVFPDPYACESYHEVAELAAEAKKQAKKEGGNTLFISRRRKVRLS
ncbi:GGDEF domain-containing protein [Neptunomonas marina]|uniref:GGDEF domain-containing protein n=1 Tax=Neptunomonas marina TaxID=1815562 RepID=A0A437QA15_9GAMM|nr:GGDEF domain-containing protein [Neptunomonas marina]RVU31398.1 GGDEF domain-containing protein [Neptunomonas marina]